MDEREWEALTPDQRSKHNEIVSGVPWTAANVALDKWCELLGEEKHGFEVQAMREAIKAAMPYLTTPDPKGLVL